MTIRPEIKALLPSYFGETCDENKNKKLVFGSFRAAIMKPCVQSVCFDICLVRRLPPRALCLPLNSSSIFENDAVRVKRVERVSWANFFDKSVGNPSKISYSFYYPSMHRKTPARTRNFSTSVITSRRKYTISQFAETNAVIFFSLLILFTNI